MNDAIKMMLQKYQFNDTASFEYAIKQMIQEIALLGLWRAKFFEHVAFYGGSALRIFYQLDRFSEDLDFSLLKPDPAFELKTYFQAIKEELNSFEFDVSITEKQNKPINQTQSAFIKLNTLIHLLEINTPKTLTTIVNPQKILKIKFEVDVDPPDGFSIESKYLLSPTEFYVKTYCLPDLFAGKMHAVLCRNWQTRVKGRDWYDMVWFIKKNVKLNLIHLEKRMKQTGHLKPNEVLTQNLFYKMLEEKIGSVDIKAAIKDVEPFIQNPERLQLWSKEFFLDIIKNIKM